MSALTGEGLQGEALLEAVTVAMVALHVRYHGRAPTRANTRMIGDELLACLMGEVYTEIEKTMIELQRQAVVKDVRSAFAHAMEHRFVAEVERLSGRRRVTTFISTHHVGPTWSSSCFGWHLRWRQRQRRERRHALDRICDHLNTVLAAVSSSVMSKGSPARSARAVLTDSTSELPVFAGETAR